MAFDEYDRREDLLETILHRLDELEGSYEASKLPDFHVRDRFYRLRKHIKDEMESLSKLQQEFDKVNMK